MELIAKDIDTGKRLDKFVFNNVKNSSFFHIIKSIQNGKILVNKKQQALNYKVKIGDVITLDFTKKNEQQKEPQHISIKPKIDIRYEDDNIIIVNKPVGLASHSDHNNDDSMLNKVQKSCFSNEHIELCNRLDKNTQGLMIFTKTNIAHTEMNKLIEQKNIQKYYLTKIYGQFIKSEGLLTD
jgi:23S rRNA pseudouridine955/2504/2580 synthase